MLIGLQIGWSHQLRAQNAQKKDFTYTVKGSAGEKQLVIDNFFADVEIIGTNSSEIKITAIGYKGLPEKAKGLRPLGGGGQDNTEIGLSFNPNGNIISVSAANRISDDARYTFYLPKDMKLRIANQGWRGGDILIKGMSGEVEATTQVSDLVFEDVNGPVVVHTLSADITVKFTTVSQASPTSISSTSGDIDVYLPASAKGTFMMNTTSGGVYTDVDFDLGEKASTKRMVGSEAVGKLKGGGVQVSLKSISGDIYIRKSN